MQELNIQEINDVSGGLGWKFVLEAVGGGLIYETAAAGVNWVLEHSYGGRGEFPSVPRAGHE